MGFGECREGAAAAARARAGAPTPSPLFSTSPPPSPLKALGADILARLAEQRTTLERARASAAATGEAAGESSAILKKMGRWWPF